MPKHDLPSFDELYAKAIKLKPRIEAANREFKKIDFRDVSEEQLKNLFSELGVIGGVRKIGMAEDATGIAKRFYSIQQGQWLALVYAMCLQAETFEDETRLIELGIIKNRSMNPANRCYDDTSEHMKVAQKDRENPDSDFNKALNSVATTHGHAAAKTIQHTYDTHLGAMEDLCKKMIDRMEPFAMNIRSN